MAKTMTMTVRSGGVIHKKAKPKKKAEPKEKEEKPGVLSESQEPQEKGGKA